MIEKDGTVYLSYSEAARQLKVSQPTISRMVAAGKLERFRFAYGGQRKFVRQSDIEGMDLLVPITNEEHIDEDDIVEKVYQRIREDRTLLRELLNSTGADHNGNASQDSLQEAVTV